MTTVRWRIVAVVVIVLASGLASVGAARRNLAYVQLVRGRLDGWRSFVATAPETTRAGQLAHLRAALQRGDWAGAGRVLALQATDTDRLAPLLVIQESERRVARGDLTAARAALSQIGDHPGYDAGLSYRLGEAWERAQSTADAERAYERGARLDAAGRWAEGRYRIAMIYQREGQWAPLERLLAPLLDGATDDDLERPIRPSDPGGAVWQGTFLALGEAYEHLGRPRDAKATYARLAAIAAPRRDWTLNRALVQLGAARRADGELASALEPIVRGLDVARLFEPSWGTGYELNTAAEAGRLVETARAAGQLDVLERAADALTEGQGSSTGAWFVRGLISEARCDLTRARADFARATTLSRGGTAPYLIGRPSSATVARCRQP